MSTAVSLGLLPAEPNSEAVFVRLLQELSHSTRDIKYNSYRGWHGSDRAQRVEAEEVATGGFLSGIMNSSNCLKAELGYHMKDGRLIPMEVFLHGRKFENGRTTLDCGPIRLVVSVNDLARLRCGSYCLVDKAQTLPLLPTQRQRRLRIVRNLHLSLVVCTTQANSRSCTGPCIWSTVGPRLLDAQWSTILHL